MVTEYVDYSIRLCDTRNKNLRAEIIEQPAIGFVDKYGVRIFQRQKAAVACANSSEIMFQDSYVRFL